MVIGIITFLVVAGAGVGGYFYMNNMQGSQAAASGWESVEQNDASSIRAFLAGEPGEFRDEAETALATLEEQTFDAARDADTIEAFEGFLTDFPESDHAIEARGRIAELRSMPAEGEVPVEGVTTETLPDPDLVPPGSEATPSEGGPLR